MRDLCLQDKELYDLVQKENDRQIFKWGIQDRDPFHWLSITAKEFGELAKAVNEDNSEDVIKEAIQTATLCLKIAEMYRNA